MGKVFTGHADKQRGYLDNPLTKEEIIDKFWANVAFSKTVSRKNAEKALAMLENLEEIDSVPKIVKLLVAWRLKVIHRKEVKTDATFG